MRYLFSIAMILGVFLFPSMSFAKGNGPDISTVYYPSNVQAGISTALSASVSSAIGVQSCHLYVDSEDIGAMNLTPSTANTSYIFPRGGVFTVFVFCRDPNGGMSSGPNTSILVSGDIIEQPIYSGGTSQESSAPSQPESNQNQPATSTPSVGIQAGALIKLDCPTDAPTDHPCKTVYYYGKDLKRHAFPNAQAYFTWYENFDSVTSTDEATLQQIPLGRNVTYRPAKKMVKFQTVDRVYTVSRGGVLRWVTTETMAKVLYGEDWNTKIDDISDAFYMNYTFGNDIEGPSDYDTQNELNLAPTIDDSLR